MIASNIEKKERRQLAKISNVLVFWKSFFLGWWVHLYWFRRLKIQIIIIICWYQWNYLIT